MFAAMFKRDYLRQPSGSARGGQFAKSKVPSALSSALTGFLRTTPSPGAAPAGTLSAYYDRYDDPKATARSILKPYSYAEREEIARATAASVHSETSKNAYTVKSGARAGQYTAERTRLHLKIINAILSPEAVAAATPAPGESPTLVVLGGRGGSGKSSFTNGRIKEFDAAKFLTLDSDEIKRRLNPPYVGWNAFTVHEESSDLFEAISARAKQLGLNLIHDTTLKSDHAKQTVSEFKQAGYRVEGHYMFVPRQVSAKRAVERYLGNGPGQRSRLVPPEVILENTNNERNFDSLKSRFDNWSAYDNQGAKPVLIERKKL